MVEDWRKEAACRGQDPNLYVPEKKSSRDTTHYDKTTCNACPVQSQCLDYALSNRAKKGLWGGTTPKQREKMYSSYTGERHHELDLDRLLFPRKHNDADILAHNETAEDTRSSLLNPLAPNGPLYFTWVTEIYVQGTLF